MLLKLKSFKPYSLVLITRPLKKIYTTTYYKIKYLETISIL